MNVTPFDLRQQRFRVTLRGYDRGEVKAFLSEVADDYEGAVRETERLKQELARLEATVSEHRGQERHLKDALLTVQRVADEIREKAKEDADRVVREAQGRADLLLVKSQGRLEDMQHEIEALRTKRKEAEAALEGIVAVLHRALEFVREPDPNHREEKILLHRPRQAEMPPPPARAVEGATG